MSNHASSWIQKQLRAEQTWIYVGAIVLSAIAHFSLIEGLGAAAKNAPRQKFRAIEFAVIEPPPPPREEKPPPEPPKPKPVDLTDVKVPPPEDVIPPPNTSDGEEPVEEAKPVFGISMSSVVGPGGSGFSVRVGNTLMKDPEEEFTPVKEVKKYKPVPLHKVSKMPKPTAGQCPEGEYPVAAKKLGIEGKVKLSVEILPDGAVGEVLVTKGIGHGLDEAAVAAMKSCTWEPATLGGDPVTTRITYTYTFVINE